MITYQIDREAHLVTCQVTISLRVLDVANFIERLWSDPAFDTDFDTLVLVDGATVAPDIIARNALAELLLAWRKLHLTARWAFVLPGSAWRRIAAKLIDDYELGDRNVRCLSDTAAAKAWFEQRSHAAAMPS